MTKFEKAITFCPKCKRDLARDKFDKNKSRKNGLNGWCKDCLLAWRQDNRQSANDRAEAWRQIHNVKDSDAKKYSRQRGLEHTVLLPNVYKDTEIDYCWHHITDNLVIAVPLSMHQHYCFSRDIEKHRELVNERIETLYGINLKELINNEV